MLGGGAATTPDQAGAHLAKGQGVFTEVIGVGRVHDAPTSLFGPTGVGHNRVARLRHSLPHLVKNTPDLRRASRTVDSYHLNSGFGEGARHPHRAVTQQREVVAGER